MRFLHSRWNRDDAPAPKNNALAIDTGAAELLRGAVATDAVLPEDGLNVAGEVDFGGRLRGHNRGGKLRYRKADTKNVNFTVFDSSINDPIAGAIPELQPEVRENVPFLTRRGHANDFPSTT